MKNIELPRALIILEKKELIIKAPLYKNINLECVVC